MKTKLLFTPIPTVASKERSRNAIKEQTEDFLKRGGKIEEVPPGKSTLEFDGLSESTKAKLNCR